MCTLEGGRLEEGLLISLEPLSCQHSQTTRSLSGVLPFPQANYMLFMKGNSFSAELGNSSPWCPLVGVSWEGQERKQLFAFPAAPHLQEGPAQAADREPSLLPAESCKPDSGHGCDRDASRKPKERMRLGGGYRLYVRKAPEEVELFIHSPSAAACK